MIQRQSLFRQEVIEFQRQHRQWGEVVLLQSLSTKVIVWFIVAMIAVAIILLSLAEYARKETVVGYLTPSAGSVNVFAPRQGTIKAIHVEDGQEVQEGDPLLTIAIDQTTADGENVDAAILDTLTRQKDLLVQRIAAEEDRTASERERLTAQIHGLETEISHINVQIEIQSRRVELSKSYVASAARLNAKNFISDVDYKHRQENLLEQEQALSSLQQVLSTRQNQLIETRYSLQQLPVIVAERTQVFVNQLSEAEQHIAEINGRRAYVIRAPVAGRISTLQAAVGQTANPQHLQLKILPTETNKNRLQAELFVPTRAIGFVRPGQRVRIHYDAFPYQQFGTYGGQVIKVSESILMSSDLSVPVQLREPSYKATVALDRPDIDAYGKKVRLQTDMLLRADIILEKRSLMKWLLDPLLSARM